MKYLLRLNLVVQRERKEGIASGLKIKITEGSLCLCTACGVIVPTVFYLSEYSELLLCFDGLEWSIS